MNLKKELGEKIKRVRKQRNLTQETLAEMVDISPRSLSNIELGVSFVKAETLEKILDSLNISTEELFANNHIKSNHELIREIDKMINATQNNTKLLEKIYKIIKCIIDDV
ncbi:helix-turn-helix transcriptional regulator [bacterium]|nr:helix-turn-helix transcriptional regulator [bacterium]